MWKHLSIALLMNISFNASYYGDRFQNKLMANGKKFDKNKMTCAADKSFKLGDKLKITNILNNKEVIVTVTDRGNFKKYNRVIDLSENAFSKISNLEKGVIQIKIEKL